MHGIRVTPIFRYPAEHLTKAERAVRPSRRLREFDGPDFALFFACVLPDLEPLTWFASERTLQFPADCDGRSGGPMRIAQEDRRLLSAGVTVTVDQGWILPPGSFADHARFVTDDWGSLYGFTEPPDDWREWMHGRFDGETRRRAAYLDATVDACFLGVDGAYWEFHARVAWLVERVREHLGGVAGLRLERAELAGSAGL